MILAVIAAAYGIAAACGTFFIATGNNPPAYIIYGYLWMVPFLIMCLYLSRRGHR